MALTVSALVLGGCSLFDGKKNDEGDSKKSGPEAEKACVNTLEYLEDTAWPSVFGSVCSDCHAPGGVAPENGAHLVLMPPGYPNFLERNLQELSKIAAYEVDDTSILLLKPTGKLDHGGGRALAKDSTSYEVLEKFVGMLQAVDSCDVEATAPEYPKVQTLSARGTFRKAALHLAYRLPTSDEYRDLDDEGEDALPELIDGLFEEEAFYERLKDIFNEKFLSERYLAYTGYAVNLLNDTMYPEAGEAWDQIEDEDLRRAINHSLADEPLDFVAYLVRSNKPFTDVVAGDYMVVNPLTAPYLNGEVEFEDENDWTEFREVPRRGVVEFERDQYKKTRIPNAGVLTSPVFLNRFPSTETNRNRHRARKILEIFLGTDLLKIGDRPLDPTQAGLYPNPTLNDPSCAACHEIMDPIAGAFQKYDDNDQERYRPTRTWYGEMRAAGFNEEQMPTDELDKAPLWLGKRIAKDPRFPFAMVRIVYEGLMGREPVAYPTQFEEENHDAKFAAWQGQDALFSSVADKFVASDYNLRTVFRELLLSPFYRAIGSESEPGQWQDNAEAELGTARLSTPMLLARKIEAVTGLPWSRGWDRSDNLMSDFRILYGGIDSDTVTKRLTKPNGVMMGVAWRMANEMACTVVPWDFYQPEDERKLFPLVSVSDAPETPGGDPVAAAEGRIRENIIHLHERILGEILDADSPELERTYQLFLEAWREGQELIADENNEVRARLPWRCSVREDRVTGEELPEEARLEDDELYTIRAWMAVVTYLLSDYEFLYE